MVSEHMPADGSTPPSHLTNTHTALSNNNTHAAAGPRHYSTHDHISPVCTTHSSGSLKCGVP